MPKRLTRELREASEEMARQSGRPIRFVANTTSQPWPAGTPFPAGVRLFDAREAAQLNQSRAFILRLDVLARLPVTRAWFPDMEQRDRGIIAVASASLRNELTHLATNLVRRRRDLLQMRGP